MLFGLMMFQKNHYPAHDFRKLGYLKSAKNQENQLRQGFSQATKDRATAASARLTASEA